MDALKFLVGTEFLRITNTKFRLFLIDDPPQGEVV